MRCHRQLVLTALATLCSQARSQEVDALVSYVQLERGCDGQGAGHHEGGHLRQGERERGGHAEARDAEVARDDRGAHPRLGFRVLVAGVGMRAHGFLSLEQRPRPP